MRLAISSWSLRDHINEDFLLPDFPAYVVEEFGVHAVEVCQVHVPNFDSQSLDLLAHGLSTSQVKVVNMPVDMGDISQADERKRSHDLRVIKVWMDVAAYLSSPAVRVNSGSGNLQTAIESYRELAEYGNTIGVKILLENHGGLSAELDNIRTLISYLGPELATSPDFGNFSEHTRYEGLALMAPLAEVVHAKTYDFDASGEFDDFDFARCLKILRDAEYRGYLSVEFEGDGDQPQGVQKSIELIRSIEPSVKA